MKKLPPFSATVSVMLNVGLLSCAAFLGGCDTPAQHDRMGGATEYLSETSTRPVHHRTADDGGRPTRTASRHTSTETVNVGSSPSPAPTRKVESEIRDSSELKIDDETRQRMDTGGSKTTSNNKKSKPKKVEAEVRNTSDLQIDEQTKKEMDKPK